MYVHFYDAEACGMSDSTIVGRLKMLPQCGVCGRPRPVICSNKSLKWLITARIRRNVVGSARRSTKPEKIK